MQTAALIVSLILNVSLWLAFRKARRQLRAAIHSRDNWERWYDEICAVNDGLAKNWKAVCARLQELRERASAPFAVALLALALCSGQAHAQQVSNPPEDSGRPWLVVITHKTPWPQERLLLDMLSTDPSLVAVRQQCHFAHYDDSNKLYTERYAKTLGADRLPAVILQRADGGVLYLASGGNVPASASELFDQMSYYASLDPTRGYVESSSRGQCPGPRCPPDRPDCDGDTCPIVPGVPNLSPIGPSVVPMLPDSSELLRRPAPLKDAASIGVYLLIGGALLVVFCGVCLVGLVVLFFAFRTPRS